ncbi:hypothetical protein GMMP15_940043 [Candidatus Magnetomoraceae bacterium gMMP-15]
MKTIKKIVTNIFFIIICLIVFPLLAFISSIALAEVNWISFDDSTTQKAPEVTLIESDLEKTSFGIHFFGAHVSTIKQNNVSYTVLRVPQGGTSTEIGKPELPSFTQLISVSHGAELEAQVINSSSKILSGYNIYPLQEPGIDLVGAPEPPFIIDNATYQTDAFYPAEIVQLEDLQIIRGVPYILIRIFPVQYNPVTKEQKIYSDIQIRFLHSGGDMDNPFGSKKNRDKDRVLFDRLFLNSSVLNEFIDIELGPDDSNDYKFLIISHADFEAQANLLAQWKKQKGIKTKVVTTDITGGTTNEIKTYITDEYNNFAIDSVLLLGDAEFIPTYYETLHPYHSIETGTDLYYVTLDGIDYIPDIIIGRIPVDTISEAQTVINKIINYEKYPVTDTDFYKNISVAAYFQDNNNDGFEDRRFVLTSEEIRDFLEAESYNVERIYTAQSNVTPTNYNSGSYDAGIPLPPELLRANGFQWNGNSTDITTAINSGRFILNHRDHGADRNMGYSFTGWGDPDFDQDNVTALTNDNLLPIVFSINCATGWFDGETDAYATRNFESFSELFLLQSGGGASGVIGASRVSYSGYNDDMAKGFYDAIWPDFIPGYGSGSAIYQMGEVLRYGKIYMSTLRGESTIRKTEFEEFHYFGDPTMEIWTDVPQDLAVFHNSVIPIGAESYSLQIAEDDALVSLVKDGEILGTAISNSTSPTVTVNFEAPIDTTGQIQVTVTKHNFIPYLGKTNPLYPFETVLNCYDDPNYSGVALSSANINNLALISLTDPVEPANCNQVINFMNTSPYYSRRIPPNAEDIKVILEHFTGNGDGVDPTAVGGSFNWSLFHNSDVEKIMYNIAYWHFMNGYGAAVPTQGDYRHWVTVENVSADFPFNDLSNVNIQGFWVDDPGENFGYNKSFKAADIWKDSVEGYYLPTNGNEYEAVIEPPLTEGNATFLSSMGTEVDDWEPGDMAIVGINEFGLNKNTSFNQAYKGTTPGTPIPVTRIGEGYDFWLVPFLNDEGITVVVRLDANNGAFIEAAYDPHGNLEFPIDPSQPFDPTLEFFWGRNFEKSSYYTLYTPKNLIAYPRSRKIELYWDSVMGADYYRICRNGTSFYYINKNSFIDYNVINSVEYIYTVTAIASTGYESAESTSVSAIPSRSRTRR